MRQDLVTSSTDPYDNYSAPNSLTVSEMILDFSLGLVNRTGAYFLGRDIVQHLGDRFDSIRYWRATLDHPPEGFVRRIFAKLMFMEMNIRISSKKWPRRITAKKVLYLDPLYVLTGGVSAQDIVLCHDLGPITHPDLYHSTDGYRAAYDLIAQAKPGMVFVSDASRAAFEAHYGSDFRFLKTIPLYVRDGVLEGAKAPFAGVTGRFLLCVGAVGARKNQARLIEAFNLAGLEAQGLSLVIVGAREYGYDMVAALAADSPGVILSAYATDEELRWLYAHAEAFCLPSLLEGFGMPALEAAHRGLVCVVSGGGALEEAVGGHAVLVDPTDVESIANGMHLALKLDGNDRLELTSKAATFASGLTRKRFISNWTATTQNEGAAEAAASD